MPLYSADALILRTYKLGEADRIVVFLTRDRGKKRGVAKGARRTKSNFAGALEPLTHVRVAYFEKEQRELVNLNYSEASRSALSSGTMEGLGCAAYFAELIDEWAAESHEDERLFRLGVSMVDAIAAGVPTEPLTRYFEYWLLSLQGVYPASRVPDLSVDAQAFLNAARKVGPQDLAGVPADRAMLRELEGLHRSIIATHLEREPRSIKVLKDMTRL
ncbi:MAG TPA: DNA repair protein RecO [Vicinamibacterales bacterium]|nr:DNA repair protein RecO [Vicinamibacterales bacterium]